MRTRLGRAALLVAVASAGCSVTASESGFSPLDAAPDHTVFPPPDAAMRVDASGQGDAAPLHTSLRLTLLAPLGFGVDVCLRSGTLPFQGPLLYNDFPSAPDGGKDAPLADASPDALLVDGGGASDAGDDALGDADAGVSVDALDAGPAASDSGARAGGILYQNVSSYVDVPLAGTVDVAVVLGGASSCGQPLATQRVTLDPGKYSTLVILGGEAPADAGARPDAGDAGTPDGGAAVALSIVVLTDDPSTSTTLARARFFNALTWSDAGAAAAVEVTAFAAGVLVPLASVVPVDGVGATSPASPAVDALGYWSGAPLVTSPAVDLLVHPLLVALDGGALGDASVDAAASGWTFAPNPEQGSFHLVAASNHTGFLVGQSAGSARLIWCTESTASGSTQTSCVVVAAQ